MIKRVKNVDAVILCGGLGKRLRPIINDRPKALAEVNRRPFIDILINYLASYGFKRFILCTGYMGEKIKLYFDKKLPALNIIYSRENESLGTGGAIKNAAPLIKSNTFLVINGDSFCPIDPLKFINFHLAKKSLVSVALTKLKQSGNNTGKIKLDNNRRITVFAEKAVSGGLNYSSVGIYLMQRKVFSLMDQKKKFSLEYDFFPKLVNRDFYGYATKKKLIDIGTPKEYRRAQKLFFS